MQNPKPMLCTGCLAPNFIFADYCEHCGKPIGHRAMSDPFKNIHARAWAIGQITSGKVNRFGLIGTWCIVVTGIITLSPGFLMIANYETQNPNLINATYVSATPEQIDLLLNTATDTHPTEQFPPDFVSFDDANIQIPNDTATTFTPTSSKQIDRSHSDSSTNSESEPARDVLFWIDAPAIFAMLLIWLMMFVIDIAILIKMTRNYLIIQHRRNDINELTTTQ